VFRFCRSLPTAITVHRTEPKALASGFGGKKIPEPRPTASAVGSHLSWPRDIGLLILTILVAIGPTQQCDAQDKSSPAKRDLLTSADWRRLDRSVDNGLKFLAAQQAADGSFRTLPTGQPAITGLAVLAFLSRGHLPDQGPYGERMTRAIDFVLSMQRADGLMCNLPVESSYVQTGVSHTGMYSHGIAGLMLGEVYGMTNEKQQARIRPALRKAIAFSRVWQTKRKRQAVDKGGWRYLVPYSSNDSDLSVTAWQLMFLRSARNAEFDVPKQFIDDATNYVRSCFDERAGTFVYADSERRPSGGIVGGGIVALALSGEYQSERVKSAGNWLLQNRGRGYNARGNHSSDRYHYAIYYSSQAMFQLGGEYWETYFPELLVTLLRNQRNDGGWDPEAIRDGVYGRAYTTSLAILALTPQYQILPIYQR